MGMHKHTGLTCQSQISRQQQTVFLSTPGSQCPPSSLGSRPDSKPFLTLSLSLRGQQLIPFTRDCDLNPCTGLKPSQNPAWDLNPHGWDSNPAKTHGTWFQSLINLRFWMSHCRKNSVREKVIGKKQIYSDSERNTLHRQSLGHHRG